MIDSVSLSQIMPGQDISYPSETSNENLFKECLNSLDRTEKPEDQISVNSQEVTLTSFDPFINFSSEEVSLEQDQENDLSETDLALSSPVLPVFNPSVPVVQPAEGDIFNEPRESKSDENFLKADSLHLSEDFSNFSEIMEQNEDFPLTDLEKSLVEKAQASLQVSGNEGLKINNDRSTDRVRPQIIRDSVKAQSSSPTTFSSGKDSFKVESVKVEAANTVEGSEISPLAMEETKEDFDLSFDLSFEKNSDSDKDIKGMATGQIANPLNTNAVENLSKPNLAPQTILTPAKQVEVQIRHGLENGLQKLVFELTPGDLGRVQVQLEIDTQGHVSAQIQTENLETFDMLQQDSSTREIILQAFEEAGLKTDENSLQFSYADSSAQHTFTEQTLQHHQIYEDATEIEDSPIQYHPRVDATRMYDILA